MENKLNNRVVRQAMGSLGLFTNRRWLRRLVDFLDEGIREFTDVLEEIALARAACVVYLLVIHIVILYWILDNPSSQDFLTN